MTHRDDSDNNINKIFTNLNNKLVVTLLTFIIIIPILLSFYSFMIIYSNINVYYLLITCVIIDLLSYFLRKEDIKPLTILIGSDLISIIIKNTGLYNSSYVVSLNQIIGNIFLFVQNFDYSNISEFIKEIWVSNKLEISLLALATIVSYCYIFQYIRKNKRPIFNLQSIQGFDGNNSTYLSSFTTLYTGLFIFAYLLLIFYIISQPTPNVLEIIILILMGTVDLLVISKIPDIYKEIISDYKNISYIDVTRIIDDYEQIKTVFKKSEKIEKIAVLDKNVINEINAQIIDITTRKSWLIRLTDKSIDTYFTVLFACSIFLMFFSILLSFNILVTITLIITLIMWCNTISILAIIPKRIVDIELINGKPFKEVIIIDDSSKDCILILDKDNKYINISKNSILYINYGKNFIKNDSTIQNSDFESSSLNIKAIIKRIKNN